jgi:hypothetical protein
MALQLSAISRFLEMCIEIRLRLEYRPVNHLATHIYNSSSKTHSLACSRWRVSYRVVCDPKIKNGRRMPHTYSTEIYGPRGRGLGTRFSFRLSIQKLAPGPGGNRGRHLRTPPHAAGRIGGGRAQACSGTPARQPLWVTHTHQAGRRRWQGARRMETRNGGARRVETIAPSSPPPVVLGRRPTSPCNAPTLPVAPVPVGAALETPATSNLHAPTRPMARAPVGNAKTHSTPSHYDGVEHKWWLPSPPPPPLPPPWASRRRPRHHTRRRLRRATRCVGAFAAAPAQHARALRAIVLRARAGPIKSPSAAPP